MVTARYKLHRTNELQFNVKQQIKVTSHSFWISNLGLISSEPTWWSMSSKQPLTSHPKTLNPANTAMWLNPFHTSSNLFNLNVETLIRIYFLLLLLLLFLHNESLKSKFWQIDNKIIYVNLPLTSFFL